MIPKLEKINKTDSKETDSSVKVCQDIILNAINRSSFIENVTIKGGIVMRSLSNNAPRKSG